jgi:hypothetical protein
MASKATPPTGKTVEAPRHEGATRRNIPTAEYQSLLETAGQDGRVPLVSRRARARA